MHGIQPSTGSFEGRANLDLTQEQLAERLGVSFATVNRWEGGTNMPQNFVNEYEIKLKDGRTIIGVDLNIRKGKGRITDHAKETIRFNGSDLVESRVLRLIVSPIPAELQGYEGDHRLLMMRYLHETYDKSEVPKVTNN